MPDEPKKGGSAAAMIVGVVCAVLGAFGGCTAQFAHDMDGGHGGPTYLLTGIAIGCLVGLLGWAMIRERDR